MTGFVGAAFLRGINVGGHTVANDRLRELFDDLGFAGVTPFLASGNVIFNADSSDPKELGREIEMHLLNRLGFEVATFVRSRAEIIEIADHDPFGLIQGKVHVGFLHQEPDRSVQEEVRALCRHGEQVRFKGREMFWLVPGSFVESALAGPGVGSMFENRLTVRTARTVGRLSAKLLT